MIKYDYELGNIDKTGNLQLDGSTSIIDMIERRLAAQTTDYLISNAYTLYSGYTLGGLFQGVDARPYVALYVSAPVFFRFFTKSDIVAVLAKTLYEDNRIPFDRFTYDYRPRHAKRAIVLCRALPGLSVEVSCSAYVDNKGDDEYNASFSVDKETLLVMFRPMFLKELRRHRQYDLAAILEYGSQDVMSEEPDVNEEDYADIEEEDLEYDE